VSKKLVIAIISLLSFNLSVLAQLSQNDTGLHSGGTYAGDHENISVKSGNLNLQIPLVQFAGRASDDFTFSLTYNSNFWYLQPIPTSPYNIWARDVIQPAMGPGWNIGLPSYSYSNSVQYTTNVVCYSNFVFVLPDGSKFNFGINQLRINCQKNIGGVPVDDPSDNLITAADNSSGMKIYSDPGFTKLVVILRNGQQIRFKWPSQVGTSMVDRNGNIINFSGNYTITDTVGRAINIDPTYTQITYPDESGTATITVNYTNINLGTSINFCGVSYNVRDYGPTSTISSIVFPNGTRYTFSYDNYGEITRVTYPTGGYTSYDWNSICLPFNPAGPNVPSNRFITAKHVCRDYSGSCASTDLTTYDYAATTSPSAFTATITEVPGNSQSNIIIKKKWDTTATAVTSIYDGATLKKSVSTTYVLGSGLSGISDLGPLSQTVTLDDSQSSKAWQYGDNLYGSYFYPTNIKEYDFGGALIRETATTYWQNLPGGVNIYGIPTNIYGLPTSVTVKNGSGSQLAKTTYAYDQFSLTGRSAVVNHDPAYDSGVTRGNLTSTVKYLGSGSPTTKKTYDTLGNVVQEWTANEVANPTAYPHSWVYDYVDNFSSTNCLPSGGQSTFAYRTKTTDPLGHVTQQMIYPCSGLVYSATDPNGAVTSSQYDSMHRTTATNLPDGGGTTVSYNDPSLPETVTTTRYASPDPNIVAVQTLDGLGREISANTAGVVVDTTYDGTGRVATKSNPYAVGNSTSGVTTYTYDALDRTTKTANPDGTSKSMQFVGRVASSTDEGNGSFTITRLSKSDAFGRLRSVCEVSSTTQGNGAAPLDCGFTLGSQHFTGFVTSYEYDALNNLTSVSQLGLTSRSFAYDGLSRLICAVNPEYRSDNTQAPPCTASTGQAGQISYAYDADSNLLTRIRPAPNQASSSNTITTTYTYDEVDRPLKTTYSDNTTPNVTRNYDEASVVGTAVQKGIGHLTSEFTNTPAHPGAITGTYWSQFDAVGRPKTWYVCTPAYCGGTTGTLYPVLVSYDQAGAKASQSDGLGNMVSYTYDNASRMAGVTLATASGVPTHLATLASGTSYGPFGLKNVQFGNGVTEQRTYYDGSTCVPARSWLCSIQLGSPTGSGTYANGSISIQGSEHSTQKQTQAPTSGSTTITLTSPSTDRSTQVTYRCGQNNWCTRTEYDSGTVTVTVNGVSGYGFYGPSSTPATLANSIAQYFVGVPSLTVSVSGSTLTFTATGTGASTNYPVTTSSVTTDTAYFTAGTTSFPISPSGSFSMTGGRDAQYTTIYDSGNVTFAVISAGATIASASTSYGQSTSANQIATSLAASISSSPYVSAQLTNPNCSSPCEISVTAKALGPNGNYSLAITSTWDTTDFPGNPSYPNQNSSMSGGSLGSGVAYSVALTYYNDGQIKIANDSANDNWTYTYDDFNRLAGGTAPGKSPQSYSFDQFGNRTSYSGQSLTFSGANNHIDGLPYDAAGNLLRDLAPHNYTYDAEGRIVMVDASTTYIYDAKGRRVAKQGGTSREYLYDLEGNAMTELQPPSSNWVKTDVFGFGRAVATFNWYTTEFHTADWLGTRRADTDNCGNLIYTYRSMPYGDGLQTITGMNPCTANTPDTARHFTGKERDPESGDDYFGARYYGSNIGRFVSPDWSNEQEPVPYADLGDPQTLNLYGYVRNSPLFKADVDGHDWDDFTKTVGGVLNAFNEANGIDLPKLPENDVGRAIGTTAAAVQGVGEMIGGATMTAGGAGEALVTSPAAATGVGAVIPGAGVATAVAGAAVSVHGTTVLGNAISMFKAGGVFSSKTKRDIKASADGKCQACGAETTPAQKSQKGVTPPGTEGQTDHIKPKSKGGTNEPSNAQHLCRACNLKKSDKMPGQQ